MARHGAMVAWCAMVTWCAVVRHGNMATWCAMVTWSATTMAAVWVYVNGSMRVGV